MPMATRSSTGRLLYGCLFAVSPLGGTFKVQAASNASASCSSDHDVHNVPLLATDEYGNLLLGPNGIRRSL